MNWFQYGVGSLSVTCSVFASSAVAPSSLRSFWPRLICSPLRIGKKYQATSVAFFGSSRTL